MKTKTRGQALTEFALILPLLLLLVLGIIEGARIIWAYITVQNAAREATRYAITGQPYDLHGDPWTMNAERRNGCDPQFDAGGQLKYTPVVYPEDQDPNDPTNTYCKGPNDRVDAIIGVALQRGRELGVDQYAVHPAVYTATGYYDLPGAYGVRVFGQESGNDTRVDYAGKEGLNVLVQVYYNLKMLDPLYAAIIPNGYVRLGGEVQMQNEGIDSALGSIPPGGIVPPVVPTGVIYQPGNPNPPIVVSLSGEQVEAGSDLRVKLEYHTPGQEYDIYLYSASGSYVKICSALEADQLGTVSQATCSVPPATTPGNYQLVSIQTGATPDPGNHIGQGDFVDVLPSGQPRLAIIDRNQWPPGSSITFELTSHLACPESKSVCPPWQEYDIALIGGIFTSPGQPIPPPVQVNGAGTAYKTWTIPANLAPGTYTVVTYERDTTGPVIASTTLEVVPAEIVIQGGTRWPAGTTINVLLRGHAPSRSYTLRWIDEYGGTINFGPVTTDQFGDTVAVSFVIPPGTLEGSYRIISFETEGDGTQVASTMVDVFIPEDPTIIVVGGTEWPAGSLIQIELHKHSSGPYNLYFGSTLIESNIAPDASGFYQTTYVIPISTNNGDYEIRTELSDGSEVATTTIKVTSVPRIRVKEGNIVQPGADITIQLLQHAFDDSFGIYLDGNFLFNLPTNGSGTGSRVYDLSNLPNLQGGPFVLESRKNGETVASTEIYVMAPDLQITNIEFPPGPPINVEIPVTVTVFNNSPVSISGEYFDVDLYVDPRYAPTTSSPFPPGDFKRWVSTVPPTGTTQVVFNLTLRGADHIVYGRVDTSNYIVETNEANNIYQTTVSAACLAEVTNALDSAANWTGVGYGDADEGSFSVGGGKIDLSSNGSDTMQSSDNMYLVYYNPQAISGDFEVRVRIRQGPMQHHWAKAGLEIRSDVGSASSPKVDLAVANSGDVNWNPGVQAGYRDGSGGVNRPSDGPGDGSSDARVAYEVWLRIVRNGDRFTYYYSDSDSATPPADDAWTPHGSVQMANMGESVTIGLFNASYHSNQTDTSSFDNFHICLKDVEAPPTGEDFPPGLMVCSGNLIQNGGFEDTLLAPWRRSGNEVNRDTDQYEGQRAVHMLTYSFEYAQPKLWQAFVMPDWIISETTTIDLSLYVCVRDIPASTNGGPEPDELMVGLRDITPTLISESRVVANGNTANSGPCLQGDYTLFSTKTPAVSDLATAIKQAGRNPESYAGDTLQLYFYDTGNSSCSGNPSDPNCYETNYRLDSVELEVCTTQPIPPLEPGKAIIGGPLRVFLSGAPTPKQGVRVWTYKRNGELITTYSLHDSNYFFYNVDPGEYVIYSEYWDGPNLFSAFTTVTVGPGETITNLSLLLR
jgi:hypothetical protein